MDNIIREFQEKTNDRLEKYPEDMVVNYLILGLLNDSEVIADTFLDKISEHPQLMTNDYVNSPELRDLQLKVSEKVGRVFWHLIQLCYMLDLDFETILEDYINVPETVES
jgi:hypothetical protein